MLDEWSYPPGMQKILAGLSVFALALFLSGCSFFHRGDAEPKSFETRWLPLPPPVAQANVPARFENHFDLGRFLVIEKNDKYPPPGKVSVVIDQEIVLTATPEQKETLTKFLQAVYPNATGGPTLFMGDAVVGAPSIKTLEEYVSGLERANAKTRKDWDQKNPGEAYPRYLAFDRMRAELGKLLEGRDALILRNVHAKGKR